MKSVAAYYKNDFLFAEKMNWNYFCVLIVILLKLLSCIEMKKQCIQGMTTPGYTVPSDDIVIEYGNPLDITCILNEEYLTLHPNVSSENLYFERGREIISKELVTILNSSSVQLHIERPEVSKSVYNCKLKNARGVCLNTVYVGSKPVLLDDFNCTGYNYENLTCIWATTYNPIPTSYSLRYLLGGPNNRHLSNDCPNLQKLGEHRMSCTWSVTSQPPYRPTQNEIVFHLSANNHLGTTHLNKSILHYKRVIPAPPESLTFMNSTSESVVLKWSVSSSMQIFPPGLQHRIMYRSEFDKNEWQFAALLYTTPRNNKTKRFTYNLTNLVHAFAEYEVGISLCSANADPNDSSMWSDYSYIKVKTKSKVPSRSPATTYGGFENIIIGNTLHRMREIYVYWQHISDKHKNGKNFVYDVEIDSNKTLKPVEITNTYARFTNLSIDAKYTFKIWSSNNVGRSHNFSTVKVPKQIIGLEAPAHFTKLIREDQGYELYWDSLTYPVTNFTIFACMYDKDRPYQCAGNLHWKVISPNNRNYIVKTPEPKKIYQFAISANRNDFTTGMIWAECTVISNQVGHKLKNVWINYVSATYIVLNWKLDCSERIGGIQGFSVRYCNDIRFLHNDCEWSEVILNEVNIEHANITGLFPYNKYVFVLEKLTTTGEFKQKSDYIFASTHEAAPTPPINITASNVTNSSVTITWNPPISANGNISHFVILGKNHIYKVNATTRQFTLNNLTSYTNYNFSIFACTVECSGPSPMLLVKTLAGYPSRISQPGVTFQNDTFTLVEWERPKQPNGDCDIYEIRFKEKRRYDNKTLSTINTTGTWYIIDGCGSGGRYNTFFISVRAVNILNGNRYEGPWSDELQSFCRHSSSNAWMWGVGFVLIIVAIVIYLGRRMYYNCQKMRDIEVKLPPGLEGLAGPPEKLKQSAPVIEEVPLKDKVKKQGFAQDNIQRYMPMGTPKPLNTKLINPLAYVFPEPINIINKENDEYVTMSNLNVPKATNEIHYVQVGEMPDPQRRDSIIIVTNNLTINTGYVTVSDILLRQKS